MRILTLLALVSALAFTTAAYADPVDKYETFLRNDSGISDIHLTKSEFGNNAFQQAIHGTVDHLLAKHVGYDLNYVAPVAGVAAVPAVQVNGRDISYVPPPGKCNLLSRRPDGTHFRSPGEADAKGFCVQGTPSLVSTRAGDSYTPGTPGVAAVARSCDVTAAFSDTHSC